MLNGVSVLIWRTVKSCLFKLFFLILEKKKTKLKVIYFLHRKGSVGALMECRLQAWPLWMNTETITGGKKEVRLSLIKVRIYTYYNSYISSKPL